MDPGPDIPLADHELPALFRGLDVAPAIVLAVSGGADSLALLVCMARWRAMGHGDARKCVVVTVDHGLRAESASEARFVAEVARAHGLTHETRVWTGDKPSSGRQAAARAARYGLLAEIAEACAPTGGGVVVTAHHRDDVVETMLMRLARGSGLDGLSGALDAETAPTWRRGVSVQRPFLTMPRSRLVATLVACGQRWIDDPSNDDPSFERVRIRRLLPSLAAHGLDAHAFARTLDRLARARDALEATTDNAWRRWVTVRDGTFAAFPREAIAVEPADIAIRLLQRCLAAFGGGTRPSTLAAAEALYGRLEAHADDPARRFVRETLAGCLISPSRDGQHLTVTREWGREGLQVVHVLPGAAATHLVWDDRFRIALAPVEPGPADVQEPLVVRALGEDGVAATFKGERWPPTHPRAALLTTPSLWRGDTLLAAPTLAAVDPRLDPDVPSPSGPCKLFTIAPRVDARGRRT